MVGSRSPFVASVSPPSPPHVLDAWVEPVGGAYRIITDKGLIVGPKDPVGINFRVANQIRPPVTGATSAGSPTDFAGNTTLGAFDFGDDELYVEPTATALTAPDGSKVAPGTYPAREGP